MASSTKVITKDAGATWTDKPTSAVGIGTITLQRDGMPSSAFNVAILPHFAAGEKAKTPWLVPYWQVPSFSDGGNMKQSAVEVVLTDSTGTHKLNVPCMVNIKEVKPGATTTTTPTTRGLRSLPGDQLKLHVPKGQKRKAQ